MQMAQIFLDAAGVQRVLAWFWAMARSGSMASVGRPSVAPDARLVLRLARTGHVLLLPFDAAAALAMLQCIGYRARVMTFEFAAMSFSQQQMPARR